jgi:hypothetical protein
LIQCIARVGPINRIYICNNPRFADAINNGSTLAHIELVDHNNHEELRSMLSGYYFHGLQWTVSLTFHLFHGLDTNYRPLAHPCSTCSRFSHDLYDHTHLQREQTRSINKQIQPRESTSRSNSESDSLYHPIKVTSYNQTTTVVDDLIDLRAPTPINIIISPLRSVIIADDIEINQQTTPPLRMIKIDPEDSHVTIINDQKQPTPIHSEDGDNQWVDITSEDDQDQLHEELEDDQDA